MTFSKLSAIAIEAESDINSIFTSFHTNERINTQRILEAFQASRISDSHFAPSTGYGYNDLGREKLEEVYALAFNSESAIVRPHFVNGTHTIACALLGVLLPGDKLLCATGEPYDSLLPVIFAPSGGSLSELGVNIRVHPFPEGIYDESSFINSLTECLDDYCPDVVFIQRSRGYSQRSALTSDQVNAISRKIKTTYPDVIIIVDNCYGEFVCQSEPNTTDCSDLICGSLIKNPGGGLAPCGGYICGKKRFVDLAAQRLSAPGIAGEAGSNPIGWRLFFQGLFFAPHVVAESLKTAVFASRTLELLGFCVSPHFNSERGDIIQSVSFSSKNDLLSFVRGIQTGAPIDSYVTPEPWEMPGYDSEIIMAAGAFVQGASIELSADAPIREPFTAYLQGGLTYEYGRIGVLAGIEQLISTK